MAKKIASNFNSDFVSLLKIEVGHQFIKFDNSSSTEGCALKLGKKIDYNFEAKMSRVRLFFDFFNDGENLENHIASFHIDFHFHVQNMEECMTKSDEKVTIDSTLPSHLIAIAYSTSRGIVYERFINTPYKDTILPIINPYELLKEDE